MKKKSNIGKNNYHMGKNITNEIILALLSGELHVRALANRLDTNHVTIINKLKELINENVLDFKQKGKNKVYFLKNNIEARNYIFIAEAYKLNKIVKMYPIIRRIIETIQKNKKIKLAILFGSYAKGMANANSDIDIFVVTKDRRIRQELELLNTRLSVKIGSYNRNNPVVKEIERNHVIIKGTELFYEKSKFFD